MSSVNWIIRLMLSLLIQPKVIQLSGGHCTLKTQQHAENSCWKLMLKTHVENACWKRMLKMHVENACWKCMLKTHVENACWKCMWKTHVAIDCGNKALKVNDILARHSFKSFKKASHAKVTIFHVFILSNKQKNCHRSKLSEVSIIRPRLSFSSKKYSCTLFAHSSISSFFARCRKSLLIKKCLRSEGFICQVNCVVG